MGKTLSGGCLCGDIRFQAISPRNIHSYLCDIFRHKNDMDWPESLESYVQKFTQRYPAYKKQLQYFYMQATEPSDNGALFITNLKWFVTWLFQEKAKLD